MKQRTLQWNVVKDDGGQAMTEFVIVIPIILLFFFAMLQYFANVQASQLANYAAFVSARVYAVRASIDANDANDKARNGGCHGSGSDRKSSARRIKFRRECSGFGERSKRPDGQ